APRGSLARRAQRERGPAPGRPAAVPSLVRDDRQQPRPQRRALPEPPERPPRLDEPVLDGVVGVGRAAGDEVCDPESGLLVCSDEFLEGAPAPAPGARDQLALVGWTALHRPNYTSGRSWVPSSGRSRGASRRPGAYPRPRWRALRARLNLLQRLLG